MRAARKCRATLARKGRCALPECAGSRFGRNGDMRCRMCRVTLGRKWKFALPDCAGSRLGEDGDTRCPDVPGQAWEQTTKNMRWLDAPAHGGEEMEVRAARMCRGHP